MNVPTLDEVRKAIVVAREAGDTATVADLERTEAALTAPAQIEYLEDSRDKNRTVTVVFRPVAGGVRVAWAVNRLGRPVRKVVQNRIVTTYDGPTDEWRRNYGRRLARIRAEYGPFVYVCYGPAESMQSAIKRSMAYEPAWSAVPNTVRACLRWFLDDDYDGVLGAEKAAAVYAASCCDKMDIPLAVKLHRQALYLEATLRNHQAAKSKFLDAMEVNLNEMQTGLDRASRATSTMLFVCALVMLAAIVTSC